MREPLPLHRVHDSIFSFCKGNGRLVIFGAQAVNAHVPHPRMSQDVDILSPDPRITALELSSHLRKCFHISVRVREISPGTAYRVYQLRKGGHRHFADIRRVAFPLNGSVERKGILFTSVPMTIAMKASAFARRRLTPKGATDLADLRRLLLAYPKMRVPGGPVEQALATISADEEARRAWREIAAEPISSDEDADEGY